MIKRLLIGTMAALMSFAGLAGIMGDLNAMYASNTTMPNTFTTADRMGVVGGSYQMRAPVKNVVLFTFDPPRMDAGCNGIDMHGGSFSFINTDQLADIFRKIIANAKGLVFASAIRAVNPGLYELMQQFKTYLHNLNSLAQNTCKMSQSIIDFSDRNLQDAISGPGGQGVVSGANGLFSDTFDQLNKFFTNQNDAFKQSAPFNPQVGATMVKATIASRASRNLGVAGIGDGSSNNPTDPNSTSNRVLYSLLGVEIEGTSCSTGNEDGTTNPVNASGAGQVSCKFKPTLSLQNLYEGGGASSPRSPLPLKILQCENPTGSAIPAGGIDAQICTSMSQQDYPYVGILGHVNKMIFGDALGVSVSATSILGKLSDTSSGKFTAEQIQFNHAIDANIIGLLSKVKAAQRGTVASKLSEHIAHCMTAQVGQALYAAAREVGSKTSYKISDTTQAMNKLANDTRMYSQLCSSSNASLEIMHQMVLATQINASTRR